MCVASLWAKPVKAAAAFRLTKTNTTKERMFCRRRRRRSALLSQLAIRSAAISTATTIMNAISRSSIKPFLSFLCAFYHFVFAISSTVGQKEEKSVKVPVPVRTKYDFDYSPQTNGWLTGRATYFDASYEWKTKYFPHHEFGYLETNGCGYTSKKYEQRKPKSLPLGVSRNAVAALATFEMKSSCGQCYEVKCDDEVTKIRKSFRQNDFIEYNDNFTRFEQNKNARDSYGRTIQNTTFPPAEECFDDEERKTKNKNLCEKTTCYDRNKILFVQIIDICPCDYIYGRQEICCGDIPHFDLSFWAFETLAHPLQGKMNLLFRPVDCVTKQPLDAREGAMAHVRKSNGSGYYVYDGKTPVGFAPGWRFRTWYDLESDPAVEGKGVDGGFGACAQFNSTGTIAAACLGCDSSILPFSINGDFTMISLRIQISDDVINNNEDLSFLSVQLEKRQDRDDVKEYSETPCAKSIKLIDNVDGVVSVTRVDDDGRVVIIPVRMFECKRASVNPNTIVVSYDNPNTRKEVCLSEIKLY